MKSVFWIISTCFLVNCANSPSPPARTDERVLDTPEQVAADYWEDYLAHHPTDATYLGDHRFDDQLPDLRPQARAAWYRRLEGYLTRINRVLEGHPTGQSGLTARVLQAELRGSLGTRICQEDLWRVRQLGGYQTTLPQLGAFQSIHSAADGAAYLSRLEKIPRLFEQHRANLEQGLARGYCAPRVIVDRVIDQLNGMLSQPVEKTPFADAVTHSQGLSPAEQADLKQQIQILVRTQIRPTLAAYRDFLRQQYRPRARDTVGVSDQPHGDECYAARIRSYVGQAPPPAEIHQLGLVELERIHQEMDAIAQRLGQPDYRALAAALQADPAQHLPTRAALIEHNRRIVRRAEAALPRAFGRLPEVTIDVKPIEAFREAESPAAYYYPAPEDRSRPAYYYVNTHRPERRVLFNMEVLAFHEAVPGHHLQIGIAQGLRDLPAIRRHGGFSAFVEGWALYAEALAGELELYSSEQTRFGQLNFRAWRAARLVVDTGLHSLGWSRKQTISFLEHNLVFPRAEMVNEVDRYIIWPGQALSYYLGCRRIETLRQWAEQHQSPPFHLAMFHDRVLENGPLPLDVLEEVVKSKSFR